MPEATMTETLEPPAQPKKILVIDDDRVLHQLLRTGFDGDGYRIIAASDPGGAIRMLDAKPDLVLLELELPEMAGTELLHRIRAHVDGVPIVVLSRRSDQETTVRALDLGADDFVAKPFGMRELEARIRTALRHAMPALQEKPPFTTGDLSVDLNRRTVTVTGAAVRLTPREYDLLRLLVEHAGKVLTHEFLIAALWNRPTGVACLRVLVRQLRRKIEIDSADPQYILTEPGIGYRLRPPGDALPQSSASSPESRYPEPAA